MWVLISLQTSHKATMYQSTDLYLGTFLILSGFSLSLLNLKKVVKERNMFSNMLLSENLILTCIGISFIARAVYKLRPANVSMSEMELRTAEMISKEYAAPCGYRMVFMSFGPLVIPFVNGFLSLVIDNYMHYKKLMEMKKRDDENIVQEVNLESRQLDVRTKVLSFWKKYFSSFVIVLQWIIPVLLTLFMYPMGVKEVVMKRDLQSHSDACMAMMEVVNSTCLPSDDFTLELRKYINSKNYVKVYDNVDTKDNLTVSVIENVYKIVQNFSNFNINVTSAPLYRTPKLSENCMKICYIESKSMLLYMFILAIVGFFVPVMISIFILTKTHVLDVKKSKNYTFASRELLYNILFWTPVLFDSYMALLFCTDSMDGVKTSLFNVIANVYQAVKNFMNTKYFNENAVVPS